MSTTDVAVRDSTPATLHESIAQAAAAGGGLTHLSDEAARLLWRDCVAFSKTTLVAGPLQGNPEACMGVALYLHGFGIPVSLVTMAKVHVWEEVKNVKDRDTGQWSKVRRIVMQEHYQLMLGLIHRAGHDAWLMELDDTHATFGFTHKDHPGREQRFTYTWAMAERANLTTKDNWAKHPHYMLPAAAARMTARFGCPEVLLGLGQSLDTDATEVVPVTPPGVARPPAAELPPQPQYTRGSPVGEVMERALARREGLQDERSYSGPQIIAMRCEALGMDRQDKLDYVADVIGRKPLSTKDLTPAEVTQVLEALDAAIHKVGAAMDEPSGEADGYGKVPAEAATAGGSESTPEPSPTAPAPPRRRRASAPAPETAAPPLLSEWTAEHWRKFLAGRGVKVTEVIKEAARLAAERKVTAPSTLDQLAGFDQVDLLVGFVEDLGQERSKG